MFACDGRGCRESFTKEVIFELGPRDRVGVCQTRNGTTTLSEEDSMSGNIR